MGKGVEKVEKKGGEELKSNKNILEEGWDHAVRRPQERKIVREGRCVKEGVVTERHRKMPLTQKSFDARGIAHRRGGVNKGKEQGPRNLNT